MEENRHQKSFSDDDPVESFLKRAGCLNFHYAIQECISEHKDWRKCQDEVKQFKKCMNDYNNQQTQP